MLHAHCQQGRSHVDGGTERKGRGNVRRLRPIGFGRLLVDGQPAVRHSNLMLEQNRIDEWVEWIVADNAASDVLWTARFEITEAGRVEAVLKALEGIGATLHPNDPRDRSSALQEVAPAHHFAEFPASLVRDVVRIVASQGGILVEQRHMP